ncbi:MAG: hypothetical protein LBE50_03540 [Gallionellaceae bacterium]|jgi:hypothetical protein|nr:hypothetical protein [Gallionellaceae bacterium]
MIFSVRIFAALCFGLMITLPAHAAEHAATPPGADCASCHAKDNTHAGRFEGKCDGCHAKTSWKDIRFDHSAKTRFPLTDAHKTVACAACHRDGPFRVRSNCSACHAKDDKHGGQKGMACGNCHNQQTWGTGSAAGARSDFDHDTKTTFPLEGSHKTLACETCHRDGKFTVKLHSGCVTCHQKKDIHQGGLGTLCETCHTETAWKSTLFDHTQATGYELPDKHKGAPCIGCHRGNNFKNKLPVLCVYCHANDDAHGRMFGALCGNCHNEKGWKPTIFEHNRVTPFVLKGKHQDVKCTNCHKGRLYMVKPPRECYYCHRQDAGHKDVEQSPARRKCETCHTEEGWSLVEAQ